MKYLSVCSGIEAATVAWHPLGWTPFAFSEIEPFPCAVLSHHYGSNLIGEPLSRNATPNLGDMNGFKGWPDADIDVLVGGTPCQSFSVAGLRKGLADPRGNLALVYLAIADRYRPEWIVWENVPGVLSSDGGRDFGAIVGGMVELGYCPCWRVLDAQYVRVDGLGRAVPQRRRRVFVVGHLGDWRRSAAVLFERESLSGHTAPRRKAGEGIAPTISARPTGGGGLGTDFDCDGGLIPELSHCLNAGGMGRQDYETETVIAHALRAKHNLALRDDVDTLIAHSLRADGFDASEDDTGRGTPLVPIAFDTTQITSVANRSVPRAGDPCHPLAAGAHAPAIAFDCKASGRNGFGVGEIAPTLRSMNSTANSHPNAGGQIAVSTEWAVRRLTPLECERLQGFPDGYTAVPFRNKPAADGPRYKALGNSMAVNAMRWLGRRIEAVAALTPCQQGKT